MLVMGDVLSTFTTGDVSSNILGPKSIRNHKPKDFNYLDPKNSRNVKNELYQLYTQEKLIHIEKYNELDAQMNKLLEVTKLYSKQIRDYKDTVEGLKDKIRNLENKIESYSYKKEISGENKEEYHKRDKKEESKTNKNNKRESDSEDDLEKI